MRNTQVAPKKVRFTLKVGTLWPCQAGKHSIQAGILRSGQTKQQLFHIDSILWSCQTGKHSIQVGILCDLKQENIP